MPGGHAGIAQSFLDLVRSSSANVDYLAFCDQDDIWQKDKCSRAIQFLEHYPSEIPALYCSRVAMVDEHLQLIRLSDMPRRGLSFRNALVESVVWGCTVVINQAARRLLLRGSPRHALVHDRWIYLVVSAFGVLKFDAEARILHRRHKTNSSMIPTTAAQRWLIQRKQYVQFGRQQRVTKQAREFLEIYGEDLPAGTRRTLERFLRSRNNVLDRLRYAVSCDVYHQSRVGHLMLRLLIGLDRLY
jgi:hypothetical protein